MNWITTESKIKPSGTTGNWDGTRTDFHLVMDEKGHYHVARMFYGFMDGSEFADWYDGNDFEVKSVIRFKQITPPQDKLKTTKITDKNGRTHSLNWMLDQVIETCEKHGIRDLNLIKELATQKIQYGRDCLRQTLASSNKIATPLRKEVEKLDMDLEKRIKEVNKRKN